eukprot:3366642-Amphidinium_carterae.1
MKRHETGKNPWPWTRCTQLHTLLHAHTHTVSTTEPEAKPTQNNKNDPPAWDRPPRTPNGLVYLGATPPVLQQSDTIISHGALHDDERLNALLEDAFRNEY